MVHSFWLAAFASIVSAQVLTNGNSQLPACAVGCTLLQQAAQACGGTNTADQTIWGCFCQSGYLTSLYTSPAGICDASCTNANDNQQVRTWYMSNCGTDHGASEHPGTGTTTVVVSTSTSAPPVSSGTASASSSGAPSSSTTASGAGTTGSGPVDDSNWWPRHYKWVIMLIVLFFGLLALGLLANWLKRRHDRKADQVRNGFNTGITTRSNPKTVADLSPLPGQRNMPGAGMEMEMGTGRRSPARTRDAFMPYGYGYSRSAHQHSPLQHGRTPFDEAERGAGMEAISETPGKGKRVLVRERDADNETP